jgi:hypothetical protein
VSGDAVQVESVGSAEGALLFYDLRGDAVEMIKLGIRIQCIYLRLLGFDGMICAQALMECQNILVIVLVFR